MDRFHRVDNGVCDQQVRDVPQPTPPTIPRSVGYHVTPGLERESLHPRSILELGDPTASRPPLECATRLATQSDTKSVAQLCEEIAESVSLFPLNAHSQGDGRHF